MREAEPKPVEMPNIEAEYLSISIDQKGSMMLLCHTKGVELYTSVSGEDKFELKTRVSGKLLTPFSTLKFNIFFIIFPPNNFIIFLS